MIRPTVSFLTVVVLAGFVAVLVPPASSFAQIDEGFEGVTPPGLPAGWDTVIVADPGTDPVWIVETGLGAGEAFLARGGVNKMVFNSFDAPNGAMARLITPMLDLTSNVSPRLRFWMGIFNRFTTSLDSVYVQFSTDSGTTWTTVTTFGRMGNGVGYQVAVVDIPAIAGLPSVNLGFLGVSRFGTDMHIDDMRLFDAAGLAPVTGSKSVGSGGDYPSLNSAMDSLADHGGVGAGGVTLNVLPGTYTEKIFLPPIAGTSASGRITINAQGATFQIAGTTNAGSISGTTGNPGDAVVTLCGAMFYTVNGMMIQPTSGTAVEYGFWLNNGASDNNFNVCQVTLNRTNTGSIGVFVPNFGATTGTFALTGRNNRNSFMDMYVQNAYYGAFFRGLTTPNQDISNSWGGTASPGLSPEIGVFSRVRVIAGGTASFGAIAVSGADSMSVFNTEIDSFGAAGTAIVAGIWLGTGSAGGNPVTNIKVYGNKIHDGFHTGTGSVIASAIRTDAANSSGGIYDNMIYDLRATAGTNAQAARGVNLNSATSNFDVDFNSVRLSQTGTGTSTGSAAMVVSNGSARTRNNVFSNFSTPGGTGKTYVYVKFTAATIITSSNNDLYTDTTLAPNFIGQYGTTDKKSLPAWQASQPSLDISSVHENPPFLSATDLHVSTVTPTQLESGGTPIASVTTDYDGESRDATTPDIGADEGGFILLDILPPSISYTPLISTASTGNRVLTSNITDASGVQADTIGAPRIYYKKGVGGGFVSSRADSIVGVTYYFTIDHAAIGGVVVGDTVFYYVAAQDSLGSSGTNPPGGSGINPPGSTPPPSQNVYLILFSVTSYPYLQDFEGATNENWTTAIFSGSVNVWMRGRPQKPVLNGAHSGTKAWVTDTLASYPINMNAFVQAPIFDFSGLVVDPILSFWHKFKVENNFEGLIVEYSTNGGVTWTKLGVLNDPVATRWYNNSSASGPIPPPKWSGNSTVVFTDTGYVKSSRSLTGLAGQPDVRIRFRFGSDASVVDEGWAIDDVTVALPPAVDYAVTGLSQVNGIPTPFRMEVSDELDVKGDPVVQIGEPPTAPSRATNANNSILIDNSSRLFPARGFRVVSSEAMVVAGTEGASEVLGTLPITMRTLVGNNGLTSPAYQVDWSVGGVPQTSVPRTGFPTGQTDTVDLQTTFTTRGTHTTIATAAATGDSDATNDSRSYLRTLVYPDTMVRVRYDNGGNTPNTFIGFNNPAIALTAGVRFTSPQAMRLANVDAFYRNEGNADSIEVRVWAAGVDTTAPGTVLYSRKFAGENYIVPGTVGDYFTLPLGDDAPAFAAGSDFWVSITYSPLIPFPAGAHNSPLTTPGHSYYSGDGGATWFPLIITTERAWLMRSVGIPATLQAPVVSNVARSTRVPAAGDSVVVTATIVDSAGLATAWLLYSIDGTVADTVPMVRTGGTYQNGTYQGVIPGSANVDGSRIEYQIQANSGSGMSAITAIAAANSYFAGTSPLSLTGVRAMGGNRQILYRNYYARVTGTINTPNFQTNNTSYFMQDAVGGIDLFYFGPPAVPLNFGDSVVVIGKIDQFRGLTEIIPDTPATDVSVVATGRSVPVVDLTIAQYQADPETYESMIIRLTTVRRLRSTPSWPGIGSSASITMYQAGPTDTVVMRIDSDTDVDGTTEPVYGIELTGVAQQFTSSAIVYNDGYQVSPRYATGPVGPDIRQTIAGNYNVGAPAVFPDQLTTLKGMFNLLSGTVWPSFMSGGPATFLLTNASYTDSLLDLAVVNGASATNTITIKAAPAVSPTLTLRPNATVNAGMRFTGTKWLTIDGSNTSLSPTARDMTIMMDLTSPTSGVAFAIQNGVENLEVKNTNIWGYRTTGATTVVFITNASAATRNKNLTFDNVAISRGFRAISGGGFNATALDSNVIIRNSLVYAPSSAPTDSFTQAGFLLFNVERARIYNNEVSGIRRAPGFAFNEVFGIAVFPGVDVEIYNNKIHDVRTEPRTGATSSRYAIGVMSNGPSGTQLNTRSRIYNNMVYDISQGYSGTAAQYLTGIYTDFGMDDQLYHNSVYLTGSTSNLVNSAAYYMLRSTSIVENNILHNGRTEGSTGRSVGFWKADTTAQSVITTSDYNDIYAPGTTGAVGAIANTFYTTLLDWQIATAQDLYSVSANPQFDPAGPLHVRTDVATPVESRGITVASVTTDFDGDLRDATTPDIGADEGIFVPYSLGQVAATFDSGTASVNLAWTAPPGARIQPEGGTRLKPETTSRGKGEELVALEGSGTEVEGVVRAMTKTPETLGSTFARLSEQQSTEVLLVQEKAPSTQSAVSLPPPVKRGRSVIAVDGLVAGAAIPLTKATEQSEELAALTGIALPVIGGEGLKQGSIMIEEPESQEILTGYYIYKSVDGGGFVLIDSTGPAGSSYNDAQVQVRSYSYYLRAVFNNGTSAPSDTVGVNPPFMLAEQEPNNTAPTANYVSLGTPLSANVSPGGDNDYYRFMSSTGHLIVDATNTPSNNQTDVIITLYDSGGTNVLYQVDRNYNDRLEFNLPYGGVYYARIRGFNAGVTGPYTMYARLGTGTDPYEPDDGPLMGFNDVVSDVAIPFTNDTTGTLNPGVGTGMGFLFDIDYVRFTGTAGQRVTIIARTGAVGSTAQHAYLGIGRLSQPSSLIPSIFGGTPLRQRSTPNGSDMVIDTFQLASDTYYIFALNDPGFGDAEAGAGARYLLTLDLSVGVDDTPVLPTEYALEQNYPNPFNPSTEIRYALPKGSFVTLEVFNVLGQEVARLVNAEQEAGYNTVVWNGRNGLGQPVGSGLYFYRIEARPKDGGQAFVQVKKMLMVK